MPKAELRILVIVDVSNIYYTVAREFNDRLNYEYLYNSISSKGQIYRAIAYGSEMNDEAKAFKAWLASIGFELKYKAPKIYPSLTNPKKENRKADWDVQMAIDVVQILDSVDLIVLVTGDGDLTPVVDYVHSRGKLVHVIGCKINRDLREIADYWCEIDKHMLESWKENDEVLTSGIAPLDMRPASVGTNPVSDGSESVQPESNPDGEISHT